MLDNVKTYFTGEGITITDVMDKIAHSIPAVAFNKDKEIVEITYSLSANTVAPYTYIEFAENYFIEHIYNGIIGKISDSGDCLFTSPITSSEQTSLSQDLSDVTIAQYGMGYLVENDDEASTITLRIARVNRDSDYLNIDVYNALLLIMYYAYCQQAGDMYQYSRALSFHKGNVASENKKVAKPLRTHYNAVKPMRIY